MYEKVKLDCGYQLDFMVNKKVIIEIKSLSIERPVQALYPGNFLLSIVPDNPFNTIFIRISLYSNWGCEPRYIYYALKKLPVDAGS